jgi:hypothetical protein
VDGADTGYGQLYKPIGEHPFKEAGIKGFTPPSPFQVPANFLGIGDFKDFCWPTLAELINNIEPFPWHDDEEHQMVMSDNNPISPPIMYIGPPSLLPIASKPEPLAPTISILAPLIISSTNKLFFIAHKIGTADCYEWRLVCVAFHNSVLFYLSCLQDGRFLVKFYMAHPADACYNAINQRFWLQYHDRNAPTFGTMDVHLITPSNTSADRAACNHLITVQSWVNLTHGDMYLHGPFNFAVVCGRKTRDRIGQDSWDVLASKTLMFTNRIPRFDLPTYSIHVDCGVHIDRNCDVLSIEYAITIAFSMLIGKVAGYCQL